MRKILALAVCLPVFAMSTIVFAQDGDRRMMDHGRGGGMGGMGVGTGIGIGIGIGEAISRQPAAEPAQSSQPEVRRVVKKKVKPEKEKISKSDKPTASKSDTALKFDGKPWFVTHNPAQTEGKIGDQAGHQSVLIEKDGHYLKRSYYARLDGDGPKWYWYDKPLEDSDPVIPLLPYVVTCPQGGDDCRITKKTSSDPDRVNGHDVVLAGFWEWWNNIEGDCKLVPKPDPGSIPATVSMTCTTTGVLAPCNGVCQLYDILGTNYSTPQKTAAGNQKAYECLCKSP